MQVLVLNASLKHKPKMSNTEEVTNQVLANMAKLTKIKSETVRLSDKNIPVGLGLKESRDDDWPKIVDKIVAADIVIFATPIWWGGLSSLMQRAIERMDAFDEGTIKGGREVLLNKVAGIVITGSEDGAQHVMAKLMSTLSFMNFTLPPQCCTYWVGEVGQDTSKDSERRRKNKAVKKMAEHTAQRLVEMAERLKARPMKKNE